jgi:very-short-patch-repair endonuclease
MGIDRRDRKWYKRRPSGPAIAISRPRSRPADPQQDYRSMDFLQDYWPLLVVVLVILAVLGLLHQLQQAPPKPYQRRGRLLTKAELRFLRALEICVQERWRIFAMVRMADLLQVAGDVRARQAWQNKINCKHIDFVLCDPEDLNVVMAIELDDASHQRADRQERDRFVNEAFLSAGLPLLRVPLENAFDIKQLKEMIEQAVA